VSPHCLTLLVGDQQRNKPLNVKIYANGKAHVDGHQVMIVIHLHVMRSYNDSCPHRIMDCPTLQGAVEERHQVERLFE